MSKKLRVLALEGLEHLVAEPPEQVNVASGEVEDCAQTAVAALDEVVEGEAISETVATIADTMETSVERGEGMDQAAAEISNVVMEHFYDRMNYTSPVHRAKISLEGYGEPATRLTNTKVALENLRQFQPRLQASLKLAHESFVENMDGYFQSAESKVSEANALLEDASRKYDHGTVTDKPLQAGRWSDAFGVGGDATSHDIGARVKEVEQLIRKYRPTALLEELTFTTEKMTKALSKPQSDNAEANTTELQKDVAHFNEFAKILNQFFTEAPRERESHGSIEPLAKKDKGQLVQATKGINAELRTFAKAWADLSDAVSKLQVTARAAEDSRARIKKPDSIVVGTYVGTMIGWFGGGPGALIGFLAGVATDAVINYRNHSQYKKDVATASGLKNDAHYTRKEVRDIFEAMVRYETRLLKLTLSSAEYINRSAS